LNKGDFTKTTLPIIWLLFTLLSVKTYNQNSKLPTKIHQLYYPASRTSFSGTITSCRKTAVVLNLRKVVLQSSSLQPLKGLMSIGPPNDWTTAYGSYWKYPTEH